MPIEVFVDESLRGRHYLLCAVVVESRELRRARGAVRAMQLGGERRIHFAKEDDSRRRDLLARFAFHGLSAFVHTGLSADPNVRRVLLAQVVSRAGFALHRLVIESRGALDREDQELLIELHREGIFPDHGTYEHVLPHEEPLLWVADGIAWAYGAGGDWKRRVDALVVPEKSP